MFQPCLTGEEDLCAQIKCPVLWQLKGRMFVPFFAIYVHVQQLKKTSMAEMSLIFPIDTISDLLRCLPQFKIIPLCNEPLYDTGLCYEGAKSY